jgi:deoxycytidylate deaminase
MDYQDLLRQAYQLASDESTDTSTKNGALLVDPVDGHILVGGVNSFVASDMAADSRNYERPRKYQVTEHSERAVIYKAAQRGIPTKGLIMICPWASCSDCARAVVLAGIAFMVGHRPAYDKTPERWEDEVAAGLEILHASNVPYIFYDEPIGGVENLFNGEIWYP